jgi:hypothetical protein
VVLTLIHCNVVLWLTRNPVWLIKYILSLSVPLLYFHNNFFQ